MTDEELDKPGNMHCYKCGCDLLPCIVIVNKQWMCGACIKEEINVYKKLLKEIDSKNPKDMKLVVTVGFNIGVNPEEYPTGVNTCKEIAEYERHNDGFQDLLAEKLQEDDQGYILIDCVEIEKEEK